MRSSISLLALLVATVSTAACAIAPEGESSNSDQAALGGLTPLPAPLPTLLPPPPPSPLPDFTFIAGYAGNPGVAGHDDGSSLTSFVEPTHVATTSTGATWVLDHDPAGFGGETRLRIVFDTYGSVNPHVQTIFRASTTSMDLNLITGLAMDPNTLDAFATIGVANQIYRFTLGGQAVRFSGDPTIPAFSFSNAGNIDGDAEHARFNLPSGLARDDQGRLFVADTGNGAIRIVATNGSVSRYALSGAPSGFAPVGIARDSRNGTLYTIFKNAVWAVTPTSATTANVWNFAGVPSGMFIKGAFRFTAPQGLAVDRSGNVYVADTGAIRKVVVNWGTTALSIQTVSNLSAPPTNPYGWGGYGWADPSIVTPVGLAFWGDTLLFTDTSRHTVRRLI